MIQMDGNSFIISQQFFPIIIMLQQFIALATMHKTKELIIHKQCFIGVVALD